MKIHMVSEHASPLALLGGVDAGGQNVHVAELALGLAACGDEVVVHTRRDDPSLPRQVAFAPGVVVDHVPAGPAAPLPKDELLPYMGEFARDLHRSWSAERPAVVHSHFWMSGLASLQAARPLGILVAHTFHALGIVKRRHQGRADTSPPERIDIEASIARAVDLVVATSVDETRELAVMGATDDRMIVVPCGVDLRHFRREGPAAERGSRPRVVVVSRLVERKGIGNVIEAIAQIPDVELVIAGGPPQALLDDDAEARRFLDLVREYAIDDRVHFLGGVAREHVPALIRSADVVACCPWYEPFGIVAVEAMACGVPVVVSGVGGLAESVLDGVTGIHVPPRRPDAIAAALAGLLDDGARRRAMAEQAVRRARRFGWGRIARETRGSLLRLTSPVLPKVRYA